MSKIPPEYWVLAFYMTHDPFHFWQYHYFVKAHGRTLEQCAPHYVDRTWLQANVVIVPNPYEALMETLQITVNEIQSRLLEEASPGVHHHHRSTINKPADKKVPLFDKANVYTCQSIHYLSNWPVFREMSPKEIWRRDGSGWVRISSRPSSHG